MTHFPSNLRSRARVQNFTWEGMAKDCPPVQEIFENDVELSIDAKIETDGVGEYWSCVVENIQADAVKENLQPVVFHEALKELAEFMRDRWLEERFDTSREDEWKVESLMEDRKC